MTLSGCAHPTALSEDGASYTRGEIVDSFFRRVWLSRIVKVKRNALAHTVHPYLFRCILGSRCERG